MFCLEEMIKLINPMESTFIWALIVFALLFVALWKFVFPSILKITKEREKRIQDRINKAELSKKEADDLLIKYKEKIDNIRNEIQEMKERAKVEGEKLKEESMEKAKKEIKDLISLAEHQIEIEKAKAIREIKEDISEMVIAVSEKVIKKSLDKEDHLRLIEESIAEITREKI